MIGIKIDDNAATAAAADPARLRSPVRRPASAGMTPRGGAIPGRAGPGHDHDSRGVSRQTGEPPVAGEDLLKRAAEVEDRHDGHSGG